MKEHKKGLSRKDGPFVRALEDALASFNVQRQAYYSGTFVGNHIHKTLEVMVHSYGHLRITGSE